MKTVIVLCSSILLLSGTCAHAALRYIRELGVANIRAHAKQLTERLHDNRKQGEHAYDDHG